MVCGLFLSSTLIGDNWSSSHCDISRRIIKVLLLSMLYPLNIMWDITVYAGTSFSCDGVQLSLGYIDNTDVFKSV